MTAGVAPTIFESFNARALNPAQVARTFVPSAQYASLIRRRHTVIVGPRGSGKTTLLKMLQQQALEAWNHPEADDYRERIDFTGVFIGTDISWGKQIEALGSAKLDEHSQRLLGNAAFTTHVLRAVVTAMAHRIGVGVERSEHPFRRAVVSSEDEVGLVRALASAWGILPALPSLLALKQALSGRLLGIRAIASQENTLGEVGRGDRLARISFLHLHFVTATAVAIELFNDLAGEADGKWAMSFDELELAPQWIRDELIRSLRSTDERLLFKLALSPFSRDFGLINRADSPSAGNDFEQIPLWYAEKQEIYPFCEQLWYSMLAERGLPRETPTEVLGTSVFETQADEWSDAGTAYTPGSRLGKRFSRLASVDRSFRSYLRERGIDPERLDLVSSEQRAADLRKVAPIVALREFYKTTSDVDGESHARSRKRATLYSGADSLFAVTEGNPRWFIAICEKLLDKWREATDSVKRNIQAKEIERAGQRFAAMIRTIPAPAVRTRSHSRGLLSLLDIVGRFFHGQAVGPEFVAEPPATFVVDSAVGDEIQRSLQEALNAGAIVYLPDDSGELLLESLFDKRFRLSYLLAPRYGLPVRKGTSVNLSGILKPPAADQLTLSTD